MTSASVEQLFQREIFFKYCLKFVRGARNHPGGDLFAADFNERTPRSPSPFAFSYCVWSCI